MAYLHDALTTLDAVWQKLSAARAKAKQPPTLPETIAETASNHLAKQSKLELGTDAVLLGDLKALAAADRAKVRRYEARLFGQSQPPEADDVGDITICDDYHAAHGRWPAIATIAITALVAAGFVASEYLRRPAPGPAPVPVPAAAAADDTDTRYNLEFAEPVPPGTP